MSGSARDDTASAGLRPAVRGIAVVVPARDEAALIGRCLASIGRARLRLSGSSPDSGGLADIPGHEEVRVVTVVVADHCTDDTAAVARLAPDVTVVEARVRNVGLARSLGVARALAELELLGVDPERSWIASTDADSEVPETWLTSQLELAREGADVVVGTVRPDFADLSPEQIAAWTARHTPGRPNGHVHGANLGVATSSYLAAGGFGDLDLHEDVSLVERLRASGASIVASEAGEVLTSGRRVGRTRGGYAGYLAEDLLA
jgi:hypothetical protein